MPTDKWQAEHRQCKLWLDLHTYEQLKAQTKARNTTLANVLRQAVDQFLKETTDAKV